MTKILTTRKVLIAASAIPQDCPVVLEIKQQHRKVLSFVIENCKIEDMGVVGGMWVGPIKKTCLVFEVGDLCPYAEGGYDVMVRDGTLQTPAEDQSREAPDICADMGDAALERWKAAQRFRTVYRLG